MWGKFGREWKGKRGRGCWSLAGEWKGEGEKGLKSGRGVEGRERKRVLESGSGVEGRDWGFEVWQRGKKMMKFNRVGVKGE